MHCHSFDRVHGPPRSNSKQTSQWKVWIQTECDVQTATSCLQAQQFKQQLLTQTATAASMASSSCSIEPGYICGGVTHRWQVASLSSTCDWSSPWITDWFVKGFWISLCKGVDVLLMLAFLPVSLPVEVFYNSKNNDQQSVALWASQWWMQCVNCATIVDKQFPWGPCCRPMIATWDAIMVEV